VRRFVIDASVLVAAICSRWEPGRGGRRPPASAIVLRMVALGLAESVVSAEIVAEWSRVVDYDYPRKVASRRARRAVLSKLVGVSRLVEGDTAEVSLPADPSDAVYLSAAIVGGATHVLTWDEAHLVPLDGAWPFRVVTPATLVRELREEQERSRRVAGALEALREGISPSQAARLRAAHRRSE
jgi:predicted nucleic acid-binding protein